LSIINPRKAIKAYIVLRRIEADRAHFLFISLWESIDAIKKIVGPQFEKARYYPEDKDFLLELEPNVDHYEVVVKPITESTSLSIRSIECAKHQSRVR
jgi:hypothetical protein